MDMAAGTFRATHVSSQWAQCSSWMAQVENLKPKVLSEGGCREIKE